MFQLDRFIRMKISHTRVFFLGGGELIMSLTGIRGLIISYSLVSILHPLLLFHY